MVQVLLEELRLDTLGSLDPRLEGMFQKHVQHIAQDCMNRPGEKGTRVVTIEMEIDPVLLSDGSCDRCNIRLKAKSKVPNWKSVVYPLAVSKAGFRFNVEAPDSLDQPGIPFKE